jgi:hypothetical protein
VVRGYKVHVINHMLEVTLNSDSAFGYRAQCKKKSMYNSAVVRLPSLVVIRMVSRRSVHAVVAQISFLPRLSSRTGSLVAVMLLADSNIMHLEGPDCQH